MGLLDKTNPLATRESVIRHAKIFGALTAVLYGVVCIWQPVLRGVWWFALPIAAAIGAALGVVMEWQLNDNLGIDDVVLEVEDEFGIKISEPEVMDIQTVDDLFQCALEHVEGARAEASAKQVASEAELWARLKALLVNQLGVDRDEVVKSTRFCPELGVVTYPERDRSS